MYNSDLEEFAKEYEKNLFNLFPKRFLKGGFEGGHPLPCKHENQFLSEGYYVCEKCHVICEQEIVAIKNHNYTSSMQTLYSENVRFKNVIQNLKGSINKEIDQDFYNNVKKLFQQSEDQSFDCLTSIIKNRSHGSIRFRYYQCIPYIYKKLTGKVQFFISNEDEDKLYSEFENIISRYRTYRPNSRKNFMSYPFLLRKLLDKFNIPYNFNMIPIVKTKHSLKFNRDAWENVS